jgi:UDP:flavonoid glycosyltransferase YjiC (YdhE family)
MITPYHGDQPFWGKLVSGLGVGPNPIPRKRLTVDRLAQAIDRAITDNNMRRKAAELGRRIQAEDGVSRAVEIIRSL